MKNKTNDFFSFSGKYAQSQVQVPAIGLKVDEEWNLIKGKYESISFPVIFKQSRNSGEKFPDILNTGWPSLYLISEKTKSILEDNHLTGWRHYSIKLYDKHNNEINGYYGFSVLGRCAAINYGKSKIIDIQHRPTGPISKYYKGVSIDDWDGNDFFSPDNTYGLYITTKAANLLKKNKINIELQKISEIETHPMAVEILLKRAQQNELEN